MIKMIQLLNDIISQARRNKRACDTKPYLLYDLERIEEMANSGLKILNEATVKRSEVCLCSNTECMHHRGKLCMAAMFNCEDRQTSEA